ncbi:MAG: PrgI family protein [Tissierellia bacterium]|nr:PrgI family protein [Tissierellia bacterium]
MAYVSIPRDLTKVKTKVALNLTKRQLVGFSIAALIGFPIYLTSKKVLPNDVSMVCMIVSVVPIIFVTLFEKDGLYFEKYFKYYLERNQKPKIRLYQTESIYDLKKKENHNLNRGRRKNE